MDKTFLPKLYPPYDCLSMIVLKINHRSKKDPKVSSMFTQMVYGHGMTLMITHMESFGYMNDCPYISATQQFHIL